MTQIRKDATGAWLYLITSVGIMLQLELTTFNFSFPQIIQPENYLILAFSLSEIQHKHNYPVFESPHVKDCFHFPYRK
jgi:hypothetical protein